MDVLTKEQRHKNMCAIKCKGTKDGVILSKALWNLGYRYRKNDKTVTGKPDLTFKKYKIAIFVDSEFFHGKDWITEKYKIKSNKDFWWPKIERNIKRDIEVNEILSAEGWTILRFWSHDIRKKLDDCINKIKNALNENGYIQRN